MPLSHKERVDALWEEGNKRWKERMARMGASESQSQPTSQAPQERPSSSGETWSFQHYKALRQWERLLAWATETMMREQMRLDARAAKAMGRKVAESIVGERGDDLLKWVRKKRQ